jgi:hypothetical protein
MRRLGCGEWRSESGTQQHYSISRTRTRRLARAHRHPADSAGPRNHRNGGPKDNDFVHSSNALGWRSRRGACTMFASV